MSLSRAKDKEGTRDVSRDGDCLRGVREPVGVELAAVVAGGVAVGVEAVGVVVVSSGTARVECWSILRAEEALEVK
jgi:hypothetical protein